MRLWAWFHLAKDKVVGFHICFLISCVFLKCMLYKQEFRKDYKTGRGRESCHHCHLNTDSDERRVASPSTLCDHQPQLMSHADKPQCPTCTDRYWSPIDEAVREAAVLRGIRVRLLISFWEETHPLTINFVTSLQTLCMQMLNCSIEAVRGHTHQ